MIRSAPDPHSPERLPADQRSCIQIAMNLGFAYLLAAANVFFRDVQHILGILLTAWYFLTPVLFSIDIVANRPTERELLYLNPMTAVVVSYQRALLDGLPPEWDRLAYCAVFAVVIFVIGFWYFRRSSADFEEAL